MHRTTGFLLENMGMKAWFQSYLRHIYVSGMLKIYFIFLLNFKTNWIAIFNIGDILVLLHQERSIYQLSCNVRTWRKMCYIDSGIAFCNHHLFRRWPVIMPFWADARTTFYISRLWLNVREQHHGRMRLRNFVWEACAVW